MIFRKLATFVVIFSTKKLFSNPYVLDNVGYIWNCCGYSEDADLYQKDEIYQSQLLDKNNRTLAANILSLHTNKKIADNEIRKKSFDIVPKKDFQKFIQTIKTPHLTPDYYRWEYYSKHSHAIKQNIRLVFKALNFPARRQPTASITSSSSKMPLFYEHE